MTFCWPQHLGGNTWWYISLLWCFHRHPDVHHIKFPPAARSIYLPLFLLRNFHYRIPLDNYANSSTTSLIARSPATSPRSRVKWSRWGKRPGFLLLVLDSAHTKRHLTPYTSLISRVIHSHGRISWCPSLLSTRFQRKRIWANVHSRHSLSTCVSQASDVREGHMKVLMNCNNELKVARDFETP